VCYHVEDHELHFCSHSNGQRIMELSQREQKNYTLTSLNLIYSV